MKMIIASHLDAWCVTTEKNYKAYIQNARQMHYFKKSEWAPKDIIEYYCKHFNCIEDDFIVLQ